MLKKYLKYIKHLGLLVFVSLLAIISNQLCFATNNSQKIPGPWLDMASQSQIFFYDPFDCIPRGRSNSCFKINSSTEAQDFWYAEGCLDNGTCTSGVYASTAYTSHGRNEFLLSDTETDEDFGGMQYIYAENYDIELGGYEGWIAKFTKNGGNSTKKYYWVVLPDQAYSTGFGETYVATFENLSEPVYFITYDVHACPHQSEDYCGKAKADPDGVQIGKEFLGAFTKNGGGYNEISKIVGKLTSLCRIRGQGEVTAKENANGDTASQSNNSTTSSNSTASEIPSGEDITWIGDSYSCGALSIIKEKFSGISFGGSECDSKSYIMSNKGVSDRYGGGTENPPALTILEQVIKAGKLKSYLVMAIGTNAGWTDKEVDQFEDIMSSNQDTKVVFVNVRAKAHLMADDNGTNERLKALADSNENYYLANWVAAYDDKYFADNSTHPTANGGYEKWVEVISDALASVNNCTTHEGDYPQYFQYDYENSDHENSNQDWTKIPYGAGTVKTSGCGPTSMAMLATVATGKDIYPQDIIDITKNAGSYTATSDPKNLDSLVGEKYGFEVKGVSFDGLDDAENKMREYLQKGYMIHVSGVGSRPFAGGGHWIGIFKINDGDTVLVANSLFDGNAEAKLHDVVHAGVHGAFTAIKGSGGSGSCGGYCEVDPNDNIGGLTEEQAQQLADYYNSDKVSSSDWGLPHGKNNCVSFSRWFAQALTSMGKNGSLYGHGRDAAHNIATVGGFEEGTEARAYSVFSVSKSQSMCDGSPCGHTGVVVAVNGDDIITVEAIYPSTPAEVHHRTADYFVNTVHTDTFTYLDSALDKTKLGEIVGD